MSIPNGQRERAGHGGPALPPADDDDLILEKPEWLVDPEAGDGDDECPYPSRITLAQLAEMEASTFEGRRTEAGLLFARHMRVLADRIRLVDANDPQTFRDRWDAIERTTGE